MITAVYADLGVGAREFHIPFPERREDIRIKNIRREKCMKELRIGSIGSGVIVHNVLGNVQRTEGIRLEAVYSRSEEKGRALADKFSAKKVYTDMDTFLADPDIDIVYIATPNLLHYAQTKRALEAGKNVICEKPFCTKLSQARELVELAGTKQLFLVEAVPTSFLPNFQVLKDALQKIGRIRLVLANYSQLSSRYSNLLSGEVPNIFNPDFAGGCLMDINYYNVYLTVALFGKPQRAVYWPNLFDGKIDTSGIIHLQYADFTAACAGAKDTWGVNAYQIEGERGFIYVKDGSNGLAEIRIVTKDKDETINRQPVPDRWYYEVQALTKLMQDGDYEALHSRLDIMLDVVETVENARKQAGILFPGD